MSKHYVDVDWAAPVTVKRPSGESVTSSPLEEFTKLSMANTPTENLTHSVRPLTSTHVVTLSRHQLRFSCSMICLRSVYQGEAFNFVMHAAAKHAPARHTEGRGGVGAEELMPIVDYLLCTVRPPPTV